MIRKCSGVLLAGLILSGCGKAPEPRVVPDFTPPAEEVPPTVLRLFLGENSLPSGVLAKFTEKTGIPVEVETYSSNDQMLAELLSGLGRHDLILARDPTVHSLIRDRLLQAIDPSHIPNLKHLAPEFRNLPFDPGNSFSVPILAQVTGILLNPEKVENISSFADIFTGLAKDRIVVVDAPREIVSWALVSLNLPLNEISETALEQARPLLAQWLAQVRVCDADKASKILGKGDVDLAILPSPAAAALLARDPKLHWIIPEKGARLSVESLCIPVGASHVPAAETFMNFLLRPEISAEISTALLQITPNASAQAIQAESQVQNPATRLSAEQISQLEGFLDIGDQRLGMEELVNRLKTK